MSNLFPYIKTGCLHNSERYFVYGPQTHPGHVNLTNPHPGMSYEDGDFIIIRCPHGCEDINLHIVPKNQEDTD